MLHGPVRGPFLRSRQRGTFVDAPTQAETTSWQAQVVTNGGAVSAGRFIIVNNFIAAEKAAGTWALTDDYWGLWAEDTIGALTSLKQRRMGGTFGSPSFVPSRGYTFDGAANYMNTLFVPSTMAVAMTGSNLRLAVYERVEVNSSAQVSAGCSQGGNTIISLLAHAGGIIIQTRLNTSNLIGYNLVVSDGRGYTASSRNGPDMASCVAYKNGSALAQVVSAPTFGSTLPTIAVYVGALNANSTAANFRATSTGFACIGASLTPAQEAAQYYNVQTWATAVGAQV